MSESRVWARPTNCARTGAGVAWVLYYQVVEAVADDRREVPFAEYEPNPGLNPN
jgi:hypothetical protein